MVLNLQDTTQLDFTGREVEGLGEIGNGHGQGLLQHAALAVSEAGDTLGLLHEQWQAREKPPRGETRRQRQERSTEADVWEQTARAIGPVEGTRLIHVGDRHADVFGFMRAAVDLGHGFIIRSFHDRPRRGLPTPGGRQRSDPGRVPATSGIPSGPEQHDPAYLNYTPVKRSPRYCSQHRFAVQRISTRTRSDFSSPCALAKTY